MKFFSLLLLRPLYLNIEDKQMILLSNIENNSVHFALSMRTTEGILSNLFFGDVQKCLVLWLFIGK